MKLKLSKSTEMVLYILIGALLGGFGATLDIDWFKEVSLFAYIYTSIMVLIVVVLTISKDIYKGNRFKKYKVLGFFLVVLIIQIVFGKAMLFGIIFNFYCFTIEISRIVYIDWKEKEDKKEGNKQ